MNLLCRILGHRTEWVETDQSFYRGRFHANFDVHCRRCDDFGYYPLVRVFFSRAFATRNTAPSMNTIRHDMATSNNPL
jgi:hypothetical protein